VEQQILYFGIGALVTILAAGAIYIGLILPIHLRRLETLRSELELKKQLSTDRGRSTIKGQLAEQLYPLLVGCPYLPSDMRFMGMPIDYLIIDGYTEAKDDGGEIREIIFADIKQGNSQLSKHQRKIKEAVEAGRVRWETIRITSDFEVQ